MDLGADLGPGHVPEEESLGADLAAEAQEGVAPGVILRKRAEAGVQAQGTARRISHPREKSPNPSPDLARRVTIKTTIKWNVIPFNRFQFSKQRSYEPQDVVYQHLFVSVPNSFHLKDRFLCTVGKLFLEDFSKGCFPFTLKVNNAKSKWL